jgi:hypothetical protein
LLHKLSHSANCLVSFLDMKQVHTMSIGSTRIYDVSKIKKSSGDTSQPVVSHGYAGKDSWQHGLNFHSSSKIPYSTIDITETSPV